jgi:hypothetical protein
MSVSKYIYARWTIVLIFFFAMVALHNLHTYLDYFYVRSSLKVETRNGTETFTDARLWTTWGGDTVVKDKDGTHRFLKGSVRSILFSEK